MSPQFTVGTPTPDELTSACRDLFADVPPLLRDRRAHRCQELIAQGELDPAGMVVARNTQGILCGTGLAQVLPGAIGLEWFPRAERGALQREIEDALVKASCSWLRGNGVRVVQSFAHPSERFAAIPLERHGFQRVTQVMSLRRQIDASHDQGVCRRSILTISAPMLRSPSRFRLP